ncbi:hypothetical protein PROFUN_01480 [Planoprotostelium fungivorum]|uniref:Uncharacterized protein n=1 Tax=Planoprotostelium fungivorum TaxID=1890364 RepID=A0A2P6NTM9_9EUKA|nr:hypothetical protein PROFUN_01480 [Planoprotostelium fungivorum]
MALCQMKYIYMSVGLGKKYNFSSQSNGTLRMDHFSPNFWNMHDKKISDPNAWTPTRKPKSIGQVKTPNEGFTSQASIYRYP